MSRTPERFYWWKFQWWEIISPSILTREASLIEALRSRNLQECCISHSLLYSWFRQQGEGDCVCQLPCPSCSTDPFPGGGLVCIPEPRPSQVRVKHLKKKHVLTMFEAVYMHYKAAHLRFVEDNDGLPSRGGQTTRQKNFPDLWKISSQYKIVFPRIINGLWTDVSTSLFERNSTLHIKTLGRSWTNACSKSPGSNYEIMLNMYNEHRFVFTWLAARALIPNFWQSWWCCCSITDSGHMTVTVEP